MFVDRRVFRNERVDVGHADGEANRAVGQSLGDFDLIEVARLRVVDRRPRAVAQILDARGHWRGRGEPGELRARGRVELRLEAGGRDDPARRRVKVEVAAVLSMLSAAIPRLVTVTHRAPGEVNRRD